MNDEDLELTRSALLSMFPMIELDIAYEMLTDRELIEVALGDNVADNLVVVELMNRVLPGWHNMPLLMRDGTWTDPDEPFVEAMT